MMLCDLHRRVKSILSESRFKHTLGVVNAARRLARACLPDKEEELVFAAYLHDITKEVGDFEEQELLKDAWESMDEDEKTSPQIHHSYSAPIVILRDFPEYATKDVVSAVRKHTVADANMSVFDEIVFVADYIEENRKYVSCIEMRDKVFSSLSDNPEENVLLLHRATLEIIDKTIDFLKKNNLRIIKKTLMAKEAIELKIKQN